MNPEEYRALEEIDRRHWFYCGKRAIVRHWIDRFIELGGDDLLVDAGMGTGTWLCEMSGRCRVLGIDDHAESIALAGPKVEAAGGRVLQSALDRVDLPDACAAVVTLLDVLEHVDDDVAALDEMIRLVRPGGLLVITVPALPWLWSDWDVALHHRRRYTRRALEKLIGRPGVRTLRRRYFNSALLGPIALLRGWRRWCGVRSGAARAEDRVPSRFLNSLLYQVMVLPARSSWYRPLAGVSLLAVLRKLASDA